MIFRREGTWMTLCGRSCPYFNLFGKPVSHRNIKYISPKRADTAITHQKVETLYQENREVYEKLIATKDEQIVLLKEMLEVE
jgi:hypothetical protein